MYPTVSQRIIEALEGPGLFDFFGLIERDSEELDGRVRCIGSVENPVLFRQVDDLLWLTINRYHMIGIRVLEHRENLKFNWIDVGDVSLPIKMVMYSVHTAFLAVKILGNPDEQLNLLDTDEDGPFDAQAMKTLISDPVGWRVADYSKFEDEDEDDEPDEILETFQSDLDTPEKTMEHFLLGINNQIAKAVLTEGPPKPGEKRSLNISLRAVVDWFRMDDGRPNLFIGAKLDLIHEEENDEQPTVH